MSNPTNRLVLNLIQTILGWVNDEPNVSQIQEGVDMLSSSNDTSCSTNITIPIQHTSTSNTISNHCNQVSSISSKNEHVHIPAVPVRNESSNHLVPGFDALLDAANLHSVEKLSADQTPSSGSNTDMSPSSLHHETTSTISLHHNNSTSGDNDVDYPNGNVTIKHGYHNHKISWCTDSYSSHKSNKTKNIYKKFLGVFVCAERDCKFVSRVKTNVKKMTHFTPTHPICKSHPECDLTFLVKQLLSCVIPLEMIVLSSKIKGITLIQILQKSDPQLRQ